MNSGHRLSRCHGCHGATTFHAQSLPHWPAHVPCRRSLKANPSPHAHAGMLLWIEEQQQQWRKRPRPVLVCALADPGVASEAVGPAQHSTVTESTATANSQAELLESLATLSCYWNNGDVLGAMGAKAIAAAQCMKAVVALAVNNKSSGLRGLQSAVLAAGSIEPLTYLAQSGVPVAYEALQILCYRNNMTCKQIAQGSIVEHIAVLLNPGSGTQDLELKCAMCFLLTGLVAFCEAAHDPVIKAGLVPQLVAVCWLRPVGEMARLDNRQATLQMRAAAILRNLAHNTRNHAVLINAGAVDALVDIMRNEKDPASRINAAVAVACLVGHEEGNPKLQLSEDLVAEMLQVLSSASQGTMRHGSFWTVWKLCQGLASLTVNDRNKELITANQGVEILAEVLFGKQHNNEAAHRFALSALWNLAFNETSKQAIISMPGLVDAIKNILATSDSSRTKEVAKGALWTLGLGQEVRSPESLHSPVTFDTQAEDTPGQPHDTTGMPHVMLSYEWGCQQSVVQIKNELQQAGFATWMDIDKMSGSTLEAMARAVEESAVVLVCVSKRYKESQACRTEAEYAFQQRKKIVPVLMERDYKPSGWLGALMGTRLYFSLHDARQISSKMPALIKELGEAGRVSPGTSLLLTPTIQVSIDRPETWTPTEVEEWLRRVRCSDYTHVFKEKEMDGCALSGLHRLSSDARYVHETLASEFGMVSLGQRLRMVEELHRLFS